MSLPLADSPNRQLAHSHDLRRELGLPDLVLTQILFIVGLPWVGVAAKQGPAHVVFWLIAVVLFYVPSAIVVIHLNTRMPLEGGLYQWAKIGFGERIGFLVAWNLWLFAILNTSEVGIQATQYLEYVVPSSGWLTGDRTFIGGASAAIFAVLMWLGIRGLSVGKWVHKSGGTLREFHPLATAAPVMSIMSLNLLGKMGFGAFGGFEYVAIHAGECHDPVRTIGRSVLVAAPVIALMFILGTSSVLGLIPIDRIDLIAPIPQVLAVGFAPLGLAAAIAPVVIAVLLVVRVAQASVLFTGSTRMPMVAGWDGLLPEWFTRMHPRHGTPANSILFVGAATFAFSIAGVIGVGKQEAFQLLWNASAIFYALTYLVMFAVPLVGLRGAAPASAGVRLAALSGFLMTVLFVALSIVPIVEVQSRVAFALKITSVIVVTNAIGLLIFRRSQKHPLYFRNASNSFSVSSGTSSGRKCPAGSALPRTSTACSRQIFIGSYSRPTTPRSPQSTRSGQVTFRPRVSSACVMSIVAPAR
jgi:amino acid transporter